MINELLMTKAKLSRDRNKANYKLLTIRHIIHYMIKIFVNKKQVLKSVLMEKEDTYFGFMNGHAVGNYCTGRYLKSSAL